MGPNMQEAIKNIQKSVVSRAEHQDLLEKHEKLKEKYEQSDIAELHKEIGELNQMLKEADEDIEEYKTHGEKMQKEFLAYMNETNKEIKALKEMNANLKKQRDNVLQAYHGEVMR